jgi:outer membrane protein OmpA-like peptidoglycan-associated protein
MRVSWVLALSVIACGVAHAQTNAPAGDSSGVTVDMGALNTPPPIPRKKPSPEEMRPLAQARPRAKPAFEPAVATAVEPAPVEAAQASVAPPPVATRGAAPVPRAKPGATAALVPASRPMQPIVEPDEVPKPAVAPVVIVSAPTTDTSIGVEISGIAQEIGKPGKPIDPTAGFAVLSRVRFTSGRADIPAQAQATLDALAQRLITTTERVRLAAFSGKTGDRSSDARRMSLTRALAIRSYLVAKGVSIDRVDVLAFGGPPNGVSDRVDVLVRGI